MGQARPPDREQVLTKFVVVVFGNRFKSNVLIISIVIVSIFPIKSSCCDLSLGSSCCLQKQRREGAMSATRMLLDLFPRIRQGEKEREAIVWWDGEWDVRFLSFFVGKGGEFDLHGDVQNFRPPLFFWNDTITATHFALL